MNQRIARELRRVSREVGKEGRIAQRAVFANPQRSWQGMQESVNTLIDDLVWPTTEVTRTIGAVAKGDLTRP